MQICIGTDNSILPSHVKWPKERIHRNKPHLNISKTVHEAITSTLEAVLMFEMKEITKNELILLSNVLNTASALALNLHNCKEMFSDVTRNRYGNLKLHALSHHGVNQIVMFGATNYTDTNLFERMHIIDGVNSYTRSSKRGSSMAKEMVHMSLNNNYLDRLRPRLVAESNDVIDEKWEPSDAFKLKKYLNKSYISKDITEDGYEVINNYHSIVLRLDSEGCLEPNNSHERPTINDKLCDMRSLTAAFIDLINSGPQRKSMTQMWKKYLRGDTDITLSLEHGLKISPHVDTGTYITNLLISVYYF
jgi:hypothetical protein